MTDIYFNFIYQFYLIVLITDVQDTQPAFKPKGRRRGRQTVSTPPSEPEVILDVDSLATDSPLTPPPSTPPPSTSNFPLVVSTLGNLETPRRNPSRSFQSTPVDTQAQIRRQEQLASILVRIFGIV